MTEMRLIFAFYVGGLSVGYFDIFYRNSYNLLRLDYIRTLEQQRNRVFMNIEDLLAEQFEEENNQIVMDRGDVIDNNGQNRVRIQRENQNLAVEIQNRGDVGNNEDLGDDDIDAGF